MKQSRLERERERERQDSDCRDNLTGTARDRQGGEMTCRRACCRSHEAAGLSRGATLTGTGPGAAFQAFSPVLT